MAAIYRYPIFVSRSFFSTSPSLSIKKKMPPKKAAAPEKKTLLGRPSNNLKIGIVGLFFTFNPFRKPTPSLGLPNVGKSSFFNALSETGVCGRDLPPRLEN
jgi:obg-like ATPase 1